MGALAFTDGVALTLATGGLGAVGIATVIAGGALTGVGATADIHPIAKQLNGERMTAEEYVKDVGIGVPSLDLSAQEELWQQIQLPQRPLI